MTRSRLIIAFAFLSLGGCGRVAELEPEPGKPLPVKPLLARATPTADELLTPPPNARPNRVDELMKRSEPRKPDPFDLSPPTGGKAPPEPAATDPAPVSDDTGPVTPGA
jgi:hypothetical protein